MAFVDGPCPLFLVIWEDEEEDEEEEATTSSWSANTAMWARVPLSLCVVWCAVFWLVVDNGSGMCMAGFACVAPRAVLLPSVVRTKMLGMNQKDSFSRPVLGSYCW